MIVRELITKFGIDVDESKINSFNSSIEKAKISLGDVGAKIRNVGLGITAFVTLPILGLGAASIKAASDAEESASKFNTVFSGISEEANNAAQTLASSFGLSRTGAKQLLGDTGDLLTGFGFTQESALDLSTQVNQLAVDLASFTNFAGGAEGASQALTKALLGERESVKSLGISILEEDVKKQMQIDRAKGLRFETERQAKAYATLILAQNQSKNAIGDFARTSKGFANQMRILRGNFQNLSESFGQVLLPIANRFVVFLNTLLVRFDSLSPKMKQAIVIFAGIAAAIGPILVVIGTLITSFAAVQGALAFLGIGAGAFLIIAAKIIAIVALVIAGLVAWFLIIEDIYTFFQGGESVIIPALKKIAGAVKQYLVDKFEDAVLALMTFKESIFTTFEDIKNFIIDSMLEAGLAILDALDAPRQALAMLSEKFGLSGVIKQVTGVDFSKQNQPISELLGLRDIQRQRARDSEQQSLERELSQSTGPSEFDNMMMSPQTLAASPNMSMARPNQNQFDISQNIEVNVATDADPEEISSRIRDETRNFFEREMEKAGDFVEQGAT